MKRSGVLLHITSLPTKYGIGTMGAEARSFIDFLKEAGQTYWQILPVGPTGYGDSPYQPFSTFAGNPYLIDLELLTKEGLLKPEEYRSVDWNDTDLKVNFGKLYLHRFEVLRLAADRFSEKEHPEFETFVSENAFWLEDYSLYMALKYAFDGKSWSLWPTEYKTRRPQAMEEARKEYGEDIRFWKVLQFFFFQQWKSLKTYAESKGISIIGDLPIYVGFDCADVWAHPDLFQLDDDLEPIAVAGCPPDGFAPGGQLWGNPLFRWDKMEENHFRWWVNRIRFQYRFYHVLRIDHFRGFDTYYSIPYPAEDATNGSWEKGPGMKLFAELKAQLGTLNIIAEDLGFITDSVRQLLKDSGFPGMKVMELGFDWRDPNCEEYLPDKFIPHCVAYTGTHDNDTILGWYQTADRSDAKATKAYLKNEKDEDMNWDMMKALWNSVADTTIVQAQDLLGLGSEGRMNRPSITDGNNWIWRAPAGAFDQALAERLLECMKESKRVS